MSIYLVLILAFPPEEEFILHSKRGDLFLFPLYCHYLSFHISLSLFPSRVTTYPVILLYYFSLYPLPSTLAIKQIFNLPPYSKFFAFLKILFLPRLFVNFTSVFSLLSSPLVLIAVEQQEPASCEPQAWLREIFIILVVFHL